jgi:hypothetical protein
MRLVKMITLGVGCIILGVGGGIFGYSYQAAKFSEGSSDDSIWHEKNQYLIKSPYTKLNVAELGTDTDEDGIYDTWTVFANKKELTELRYTLEDLDGNGSPDRILMGIGPEDAHQTFATFDYDEDKKIDCINFSLGGPDGSYYLYQDLNLDGRLDVVSNFKNDKLQTVDLIGISHLFQAKVLNQKRKTYLAFVKDDEWQAVVLEGKKWIPILDEEK